MKAKEHTRQVRDKVVEKFKAGLGYKNIYFFFLLSAIKHTQINKSNFFISLGQYVFCYIFLVKIPISVLYIDWFVQKLQRLQTTG